MDKLIKDYLIFIGCFLIFFCLITSLFILGYYLQVWYEEYHSPECKNITDRCDRTICLYEADPEFNSHLFDYYLKCKILEEFGGEIK